MHRLTSSRGSSVNDALSINRNSQRSIVSMKALSVIKRLPWFAVVIDHCIPQPWSQCVSHSDRMQDLMISSLCWHGMLELTPPLITTLPRGQEELPRDNLHRLIPYASHTPHPRPDVNARVPWMWIEEDPSAERITQLVSEHGPVTLTMADALGPGQGTHIYDKHHALVVWRVFRHQGRPVAIALDGNNLQQNELMDRLRDHASRLGVAVEELSAGEYRGAQRDLPPHLDIHQLGLRLIDLESMVLASREKQAQATRADEGFPNTVRWVTNARVVGNPFPADVERALQAMCNESPDLIERLGRTSPASIRLDE